MTPEMIRRALRKGTLAGEITPVLAGSAFKNKGVQALLDAIVDYLPSPLDVPPVQGLDPKSEAEETRPPDYDAPFAALAFKVMSDPYVGKLTYFRVYSGQVKAGDRVLNTTNGKTERIGRILQMHANHREERDEIGAGEIAAAVGLKFTTTGDTIAADSASDRARVDVVPRSGHLGCDRAAHEGRPGQARDGAPAPRRGGSDLPRLVGRGDRADAHRGDGRAAPRDHRRPPPARVLGRRERRSPAGRVPRDDHEPRPRRSRASSCARRAARASTATSSINLYPNPAEGYAFDDKIVGGKVPKEYIPAVNQGIQEAMSSGIVAGYPVVDIRVELVDGSYHEVDSSERSFKIAGSMAFKEGMKRAKPKLLEPVMAVEVVTPDDYLGDVIGNLNGRRGRVEQLEPVGGSQSVKASVPLSEMFGYATDLRSMSQGRATFTMQFDRYEEVPASIAEAIVGGEKTA